MSANNKGFFFDFDKEKIALSGRQKQNKQISDKIQ